MNSCSWCRCVPAENEPFLTPWQMAGVSFQLCGACNTRALGAMLPLAHAAAERLRREEVSLLIAEAKARHDAEVETERETLKREAAEAKLRAKRAAENVRQARTYRRKRIENARAVAQRLQSLGVLPDAAIKRAAAKFRVAEDELRGEKAA